MEFTLQLDPITNKWLTIYLYTNVENMPEVLKKLLARQLNCCILKASVVMDPFQVAVAANKAVLREMNRTLVTKSVFTEILYAISSSANISLSLAKFGIDNKDKNILVALIHDKENKDDKSNSVLHHIKGQLTPMSRLSEFSDVNLIKKMYKIDDEELKISSLTDSIVSRIGGDFLISLK